MLAVVEDGGAAHVGAVLGVVDAHASGGRKEDAGDVDAESGELAGAGAGDGVVGEGGQVA